MWTHVSVNVPGIDDHKSLDAGDSEIVHGNDDDRQCDKICCQVTKQPQQLNEKLGENTIV